ncbi:hypothetical protein [Jeotgalibacillus haloalkalitolerans]|uniref:GerMN domain-containing protein n=1 Tax=Jeotgalibacillus haloalkalitolerans TaxID=3104292 RepID=A0ABU5KMW1_9BACL|nr:hypothetical protein [Jeotgalibacillus sp. HH7-29]MDZ5712597.1 hypothetical protein [Jeotgalibacillus sp. HH7-29]
MEKMTKIAGLFTVAFLIVGCSNSGDGTNSQADDSVENEVVDAQENDGNTEDNAEDLVESDANTEEEEGTSDNEDVENEDVSEEAGKSNEEESETSDEKESETEIYGGAQMSPAYFIDTKVINQPDHLYIAYAIDRDRETEGMVSPEQRLETSLFNNDPSEQDILRSYTNLTLDTPNLYVEFNQEGNELSVTTAQSVLFYETLFGISDFYGVESITFLNPDGEEKITVAERTVDDTITVKDERSETRGYYTIYDKELEETLFLAGGELEEQVVNESGEPLSFPETIEKMGSVEADMFYSSAIVEGIEVVYSSITNGVAKVRYTMDENAVTDADRTVFENAVQLAALDFHAWEVDLINDTLKEIRTYPLVGQ